MDDQAFLLALKEYIEEVEVWLDCEFGKGRQVEGLIEAKDMPDIYAEVLRRIALTPQNLPKTRP
jgi:hypothetical protein